ncbi:MAG: two-component system phosphate regulon sensor histidine kinase PhoR [Salibacteraceae bacterium]|jgi:two-component system phosphate regulon sensor histidine kinase PhoR
MQNNIIKLLIFSIASAVIALIAMQYYWVQSSVDLRKEEFGRNVSDALKSVSDYLTRYEAASLIRAQEQNRYLFIDDNAEEKINAAGGDTSFDYKMVERYVRNGDQIEISFSEEKDGILVSDSKEMRDRELPTFGNSSDASNETWAFGSAGSKPYKGISLNKELQMRIEHKKAYIGEIEKSLRRINSIEELEVRIDSVFLDSLLHLAFFERGVRTDFEFGVFDGDGVYRFGNQESASTRLSESTYMTRLFKNDLIGKPGYLKIYFPKEKGFVLQSTLSMLLTSILVVLAIIGIFYWTVKAIITQKKNSEIKNDFINNMTHELKTPISTISLAVEVLNDPSMANNENLVKRYLGMINEENKRLGMLVEEVLQSAALDRSEFKLKEEDIDIAQLVNEVVGKMDIKVKERSGSVTVEIDSEGEFSFVGDRVHLTNVLYNLMDNAIKYSRDSPEIKIEVLNVVNTIAIKVSDTGIGIATEYLKKVFEKLYRVPTGNLHDVKGFGLGLNYVKTIVTRHLGSVDVKSVLGKGSTFIIYLPKRAKKITSPQTEK